MTKGRRPKLADPEIRRQVCETYVRIRSLRKTAAATGISVSSLLRWKELGRTQRRGPYRAFWRQIQKAESAFIVDKVKLIEDAAKPHPVIKRTERRYEDSKGNPVVEVVEETKTERNWTAAAWLLERIYYQTFGRKQELSGPDRMPLTLKKINVDTLVLPCSTANGDGDGNGNGSESRVESSRLKQSK